MHRATAAAILMGVCLLRWPGAALAEPELDVASARKLFTEAVDDEDHRRYELALNKFRRVQEFRDTVNVRYRIGTCLEGLGRLSAALSAYDAALRLAREETGPNVAEVAKATQDRVTELDRRVARLSLVLSAKAAADAEVRIDDEKVTAEQMREPIVVDPGHHTISATAKDATPFRTSLTLPEGGRVSLTIPLDPAPPTPTASASASASQRPPVVIKPPEPSRTAGYLTLAGGGALLIGSAVVLVLRHGDIATLNDACKSGICDASREAELTSTRKRALVEGPLGYTLGAAGAVVAALGVYLIVKPPGAQPPARGSVQITPVVSNQGAGVGAFGVF